MNYVPVVVPVPRSKKGVNTFLIIFAAIILMGSIFMTIAGISGFSVKDVVDAADVKCDDFNADDSYYFEDLALVGEYAYFWEGSESNVKQRLYVVTFLDSEGERCFASLEVDKGSELEEKCIEFNEDDELLVGDVILEGCFDAKDISDVDLEARTEYSKRLNECRANMLFGEDCGVQLEWVADDEAGYYDKRQNDAIILLVVALIMFVMSTVGIVLLVLQRKKINAEDAANQQIYMEQLRQAQMAQQAQQAQQNQYNQ